jgi:hypothetical protein
LISASPAIEAGQVYLPEQADFLAEFLDKAVGLPGGRYDDQVDSLSQAPQDSALNLPNGSAGMHECVSRSIACNKIGFVL